MHRIAATTLVALLTTACAQPAPTGPEMILTGATIYPAPGAGPVSALAIQGSAIIAMGSDEEIRALASDDTQEMALDGAVVLPGFHDAWVDLFAFGALQRRVDLRLTTSERDVQAKVRAALAGNDSVVVGWGWDERRWPNSVPPTSAALDAVATDRPIVLYRRDGRVAWVNTFALDTADLSADVLHMDGTLTGLLTGDALARLEAAIGTADADVVREDLRAALRATAAAGLSSLATSPLSQEQADLLASLDETDFTIRVHARVVAGVTPPASTAHLSFSAIGLDADGPLALGLAAREADPAVAERIAGACAAAGAAGLPLDVQARGETAIRLAAQCAATRLIVGADVLPDDGLPSTARLVAVPGRMAHDMYWIDDEIGEAGSRAHSYREWARLGILGGVASDAPATDLRPMEALRVMFTRRDREGYPLDGWRATERLAPTDTMRALLAAGPLPGELAAGRAADLVVWSEDPFAGEGELARAQAMLVFVEGRVIYSRPLVTPNLDRRQ